MVVEKLHSGTLEFWVDDESQLNISAESLGGSLVMSRQDTIDLLNGLGRQLNKAETNKPLFTWPWKKKTK